MARLDTERQSKLEPKRMEYAIGQLHAAGIQSIFCPTDKNIEFDFKGEKVTLFPYSGWHTGGSIKDGRGLQKLLNQLK
jgi:hypothetical protein